MKLSGRAIVQFINGLFGTKFPPDSKVEYPGTEHITSRLRQLRSDMVVVIGGTHSFLIEAQIAHDANMALRVFEYGFWEGVRAKTVTDKVITLRFPQVRLIYWETTRKTPDRVTLRLKFPEGKTYDYTVESLKFLEYTVKELERRKLAILLPFYLLKLRRQVAAARTGERLRQLAGEMKGILEEMAGAAEKAALAGLMSKADMITVMELMNRMFVELYKPYKELRRTNSMLQNTILTYSEKAERKGRREGRKEERKEVAKNLLHMGLDVEKIAQATKLPVKVVKDISNKEPR
jgi:hypothetical protein